MKHLIFTITSMLFSIGVFSQQFDFYLNNSFENELFDAIETDSTFEFVGMKKLNLFYESNYQKQVCLLKILCFLQLQKDCLQG